MPIHTHSRKGEALRMAPGSPASRLETWSRAVRKHHSFRSSPPCPGGPQTPLEHRTQPKKVESHTACSTHPDAHIWRNSHGNLASLQIVLGLVLPLQDGSVAQGWPSRGSRLLQKSMVRQAASGRDGGGMEETGKEERRRRRGEGGREGERGPSSLFKLPIPPSSWQNILSLENNNNPPFILSVSEPELCNTRWLI